MAERMARAEILEHWKARAEAAEGDQDSLCDRVDVLCAQLATALRARKEWKARAEVAERKVAQVEALLPPSSPQSPFMFDRGQQALARQIRAAINAGTDE